MARQHKAKAKAALLQSAQARSSPPITPNVSQQAVIPASSNAGTVAAGKQQDPEESDGDGWEDVEQSDDKEAGTSDDSASEASDEVDSYEDGSDGDDSYDDDNGRGNNAEGNNCEEEEDDPDADLDALKAQEDADEAGGLDTPVDSDPSGPIEDCREMTTWTKGPRSQKVS